MEEADLKFDEQKVCTKLAEEYLDSIYTFRSIGIECEQTAEYTIDQCDKKKNYIAMESDYISIPIDESKKSHNSDLFMALAGAIEEHEELFCQLEFLLRGIPINDTKNVDLELIKQSLDYKSSCLNAEQIITCHNEILFGKDTPLFHLGLLAYKKPHVRFVIMCSKETVAVCTLFVELCRESGLESDHVALAALSDDEFKKRSNEFDGKLVGGCVGVVTARCDVDSAAAALLDATTRYPWKLSSVLVQDAAMERFARALEWNTRNGERATTLAFEPVPDASHSVPVEGFRTVREALLLISKREPLAVTAWASDLSEAHEIAFQVRAPLVWLNSYGHFLGSPSACAALYCSDKTQCEYDLSAEPSILDELRRLRKAWLELTPTSRLLRIRSVSFDFYYSHKKTRKCAVGFGTKTDVSIDSGVCTVTRTPIEFAVMTKYYIEQSIPRFLNYLIDGGAVVIGLRDTENCGDFKVLTELLSKKGAPVVVSECSNEISSMYKMKAVWMSMGTIFAN